MTKHFSSLIAWGCLTLFVLTPLIALYFLVNIDAFASLAKYTLDLPIQWQSVESSQWYGFWALTMIYVAIGLGGLFFLRRAFANFARGELFNQDNSHDLRLFSIFLFIQALAKPLHMGLSSVLLSMNHPAGERMLSVSFGSDEVKVIALAMILWVMSDLLVKGSNLESENKQFV
ncbi:hypothetical protein BTA51_14710 [Hahella sp. CCB-MM4]|uniref:DUF2975 domain-containing protein n=1 Tax=Hahella sp. (strain CCB-MM4) TaxID=1926491 RepID=UPI000B9BFAF5|nr:DUF2975 domain-containing protein [Hahella sp. CCB-MM4]OZG72770.1 hypothetical protein BTA51_14710 [Hahella sp. CCB-MM4]